jgi:hypothetical protein
MEPLDAYVVVRLLDAGEQRAAELRTAVCRDGASPSWLQGMVLPLVREPDNCGRHRCVQPCG